MTFFVKNSKYLTKYHPNLFPKSRFYKYINPCLVILFCEVQNQNKQKCASRYLYQNNNKRLHFLTQTSPKSFLKISVYLVKNVKSGKTFICWEPYNKLALNDWKKLWLTMQVLFCIHICYIWVWSLDISKVQQEIDKSCWKKSIH